MFETGISFKTENRMVNCVDSDEIADDKRSHRNLYCLQWYWFGFLGLKVSIPSIRRIDEVTWNVPEHCRTYAIRMTKARLFKYIENFTTKK